MRAGATALHPRATPLPPIDYRHPGPARSAPVRVPSFVSGERSLTRDDLLLVASSILCLTGAVLILFAQV